jgi:predicted PurR-regulated permease PerM
MNLSGKNMQDRTMSDLIFWFFLGLFLISFFLIGWLMLPFLSTIVLAAVVTGVFNPVYRFMYKKFGIRQTFSAMITCILIFFILFVPIIFFTGILSKEAYDFYLMGKTAVLDGQVKKFLESYHVIEKINIMLSNINMNVSIEDMNRSLSEVGKALGLFLFDQAKLITSNIFSFVVNFFFMLLIVFFLFMDSGKLIDFIIDLSPLPKDQDEKLIQKFKDMTGAILIGYGIGGFIQGTIGGFVFAAFGLHAPFLWGVLMALLAFLPIIGIGVVFLPAAVFMFIQGRMFAGCFFIVFYLVLSFGVENILKPKIVGKRVKMHTLLVFLAIIGGMKLFGILGIIYGPLIVSCFLTLVDIYHENYQKMVEPVGSVFSG